MFEGEEGREGGREGEGGGRGGGVCCKLLEMPRVIIVLCFNTLSFHISITPNTISKVKDRKWDSAAAFAALRSQLQRGPACAVSHSGEFQHSCFCFPANTFPCLRHAHSRQQVGADQDAGISSGHRPPDLQTLRSPRHPRQQVSLGAPFTNSPKSPFSHPELAHNLLSRFPISSCSALLGWELEMPWGAGAERSH